MRGNITRRGKVAGDSSSMSGSTSTAGVELVMPL